ncbi:MAG: 5-bromo-4-chloroindolyl phosphate hydrolysis family protein [Pseudomonadota bacterium]
MLLTRVVPPSSPADVTATMAPIQDRDTLKAAETHVARYLGQSMPKPYMGWARQIIAGILGGTVVLWADSFAGFIWWQAGLAGLAVWAGASLILEPDDLSIVAKHALLSIVDMKDGFRRLGQAIDQFDQVDTSRSDRLRWAIGDMRRDLLAIAEDYRVDPADVVRSRTFLHHHVPMAVDLASTIGRLSTRGGLSVDQQLQLEASEKKLNSIGEAFSRQREALARNDVDDLKITGDILNSLLINDPA